MNQDRGRRNFNLALIWFLPACFIALAIGGWMTKDQPKYLFGKPIIEAKKKP